MSDWQDKTIAILGLGRSGIAAAKVLSELGADVIVSDSRPAEELAAAISELPEGVRTEFGGHSSACLDCDLMVVSPGVPLSLPVLQAAQADGVEVIGEIELAFRLSKAPVVAITGTNGKTTTTTLVAEVLKAGGLKAPLGGNIGIPLVGLAQQEDVDVLVAEVSSFQLESVDRFRPKVGVWLNFSDDHLNRHGSRETYWGLKRRLFDKQGPEDIAILNADDPAVSVLVSELPSRIIPFSLKGEIERGVTVSEGWIVYRREDAELPLMPVADVRLRGAHNLENCLAAAAVGFAMGIAPAAIAEAIRSFGGVEHRIEPVLVHEGVSYYNDSKGTNYDSTVKAIESFSEPLVLIAGGRDKGGAIAPLIEAICQRVGHTVLVGESAPYFERVLKASGYEAISLATDLKDAVRLAGQNSQPGGVVLFSPACTSFDMFRNYEERGQAFKQAVKDFAHGVVVDPV